MEEPKLKNLVHQRGQIKRKVTMINNALEEAEDDPSRVTVSLLKVYAKKLDLHYQEYVEAHRQILEVTPSAKIEDQDEMQMAFDKLHTEALARLEALTELLGTPARQGTGPQVIVQQQPLKAPIPTFDGNYANWPKFKAIFQNIMEKSIDRHHQAVPPG